MISNLGGYNLKIDFNVLSYDTTNIYYKEGDINTSKIRVRLVRGYEQINLTDCSVAIKIQTKTDVIVDSVTIVDENEGVVEYTFPTNALKDNRNYFEFIITQGEYTKVSPKIGYSVLDGIDDLNAVEGVTEYPILLKLIKDVNELETLIDANETSRVENESIRCNSEVIRVENEISRNASEVIRNANESNREMNVSVKLSEIMDTKDDLVNRFNALSPVESTNAEVQLARTDMTGKTHVSLSSRLLSDNKMQSILYDNTEGSNITTDSLDGYVQNVEIKGNTIQDGNQVGDLADIKSVGDKLDNQELYEIPLLCCGKNLFDGKYELGSIIASTGDNQPSDVRKRSGFIKVKPNISYVLSKSTDVQLYIHEYTDNLSTSGSKFFGGTGWVGFEKFTTQSTTKYIRFRNNDNQNFSNIQLEEGTVPTPYEPYQEHKLTILSPTQLEKVGDVADRIVEKDGVWGVEKNVETGIIDKLPTGVALSSMDNTIRFNIIKSSVFPDAMEVSPINKRGLSNQLPIKYMWLIDEEGFYIDTNFTFRFDKNKFISLDSNGYNDYLSKKPLLIKYATSTPTFIPLPHSQQVKLRTFANKTNISFLTEIEGTIKGEVAKSTQAVINTHTTQIDGIHQELERVKKLEEATTSTVVIESDFATVEQTSNGYFEDIELKGRTLVNLSNLPIGKIQLDNAIGDGRITPIRQLLSNDVLNLRFKCTSISVSTNIGLIYTVTYNDSTPSDYIVVTNSTTTGLKNVVIKPKSDIKEISLFLHGSNDKDSIATISDLTLTYEELDTSTRAFEGLKSVGEGTDEIVVSSVDGDGNLFDGVVQTGDLNSSGQNVGGRGCTISSNYIQCTPDTNFIFEYTCLVSPQWATVYEYDSNHTFIKSTNFPSANIYKLSLLSSSNSKYFKFKIEGESNINLKMMLSNGTSSKQYIEHKSDKKQLLFLDDADNTWKKPIIREWDSVEKHSDGKYYYHCRSSYVALNGSEDWVKASEYDNTIRFYFNPTKLHKPGGLCISDRFSNLVSIGTSNLEGIILGNAYGITIEISKSKLETSDVAGFKKWLQANNVTVVYQLAQEKIYECTNLDLICYEGETNYMIESGAISPKTTLKVHNNIANVVGILQKNYSILRNDFDEYRITQNRLQLNSTYSADSIIFKVEYVSKTNGESYNEDLYKLIFNVISVGKDNYNYDKMFSIIMDYASWSEISWEQFDILSYIMDYQLNPPIEEVPEEV